MASFENLLEEMTVAPASAKYFIACMIFVITINRLKNTHKYRINRIVELIELDLSDSETLFNIQFSVKVNDILTCL